MALQLFIQAEGLADRLMSELDRLTYAVPYDHESYVRVRSVGRRAIARARRRERDVHPQDIAHWYGWSGPCDLCCDSGEPCECNSDTPESLAYD